MNQPALADQIDQAQERKPGNGVATISLRDQLDRQKSSIAAALPDGFPGGTERFVRIMQTAVRMTPKLAACTPMSVIGAAMQAAQLGLTPGVLGEAWVLPYKNKDGQLEAQFQIGWKGMVALASRAGYRLWGAVVHERDDFDYDLGLNPTLHHKPATGDRGLSVYWYAIAHDKATGQVAGFAVLDRTMVEKRRKVSKSSNSPAWTNFYDEMALSKAARECCRFLPLTVEMATAVATDGTVRTAIEGEADEYPAGDYIDVESVEADES